MNWHIHAVRKCFNFKNRNKCVFNYSDKCNCFLTIPLPEIFFKFWVPLHYFKMFLNIQANLWVPPPFGTCSSRCWLLGMSFVKQFFIIWFWYFFWIIAGLPCQETCFNISLLFPAILYNCRSTDLVGNARTYQWLQEKVIKACSYCILQYVSRINISFTNCLYVESSCCSKTKWYGQVRSY